MANKGVYIASLDAKDIFLANSVDSINGYSLKKKDGTWNLHKFINVLDYSLDLIKLKEIYTKVMRNNRFTFNENGKEYCPFVINVTFKYNDKLFNKQKPGVYIRSGYQVCEQEFIDGVCIRDNLLIGIMTNIPISNPIQEDILEKCFVVKEDEDGNFSYAAKQNIPILQSVKELRTSLYSNGFMLDGKKYIRFKRSSGSSRVGKCLFIDERLYSRMHKWEMCGIKIKEDDPVDLAALEAYIALTLSSIIDTIEIKADEILVVDDYTSVFTDKVIVTDVEDGKLESHTADIDIQNSIWDGQSLIDSSLCEGYGMALVRNRFFKSCCFNTNIQKFFSDNNITEVSQLNGITHAEKIEQIKLITTPSSIKYLKFGSLEQWLKQLEPVFGVVKHEKKTHFFDGKLVQTHYQLINTLQMTQKEMDMFLEPTIKYVKALRYQPEVLRYHIKYPDDYSNTSFTCKNDVVFSIMGINSEFCKTKIYYDFMKNLIKAYIKNTRCGHVLVRGNYSTLFGNPYEMLLQSIGRFDGTPNLPVGCIHSSNFEYNQHILGSRSPHVCMGNIWLPYNVEDENIDKYFNLTSEIVCINSIKENVLQRLNGCDFDSDTVMLTNNSLLVAAAKQNYNNFLVPTSAVEAKKTKRYYNNSEKADLDIKTSENKIGEIINLAQRLNTLYWHNVNNGQTHEENHELYCDVAKLSVLSGIEIDKAKKEFEVDVTGEIETIKAKYFPKNSNGKNLKPNFFKIISKSKGYYDAEKNDYIFHDTSMDYLQHTLNKLRFPSPPPEEIVRLQDILSEIPYDHYKVNSHQVSEILKRINTYNEFIRAIWAKGDNEIPKSAKMEIVMDSENDLLNYIKKIVITPETIVNLLKKSDEIEGAKKTKILSLLFTSEHPAMQELLKSQKGYIPQLIEDENGDIEFYGVHFRKE